MIRQHAPSTNYLIYDDKAEVGTEGTNSRNLAHSDLRNLGTGTTENPWDSAERSPAGQNNHSIRTGCKVSVRAAAPLEKTTVLQWMSNGMCANNVLPP